MIRHGNRSWERDLVAPRRSSPHFPPVDSSIGDENEDEEEDAEFPLVLRKRVATNSSQEEGSSSFLQTFGHMLTT